MNPVGEAGSIPARRKRRIVYRQDTHSTNFQHRNNNKGQMMKPTIGRGTELSIGTVTRILNDGVETSFKGTKFVTPFKVVEQIFDEDQIKLAKLS